LKSIRCWIDIIQNRSISSNISSSKMMTPMILVANYPDEEFSQMATKWQQAKTNKHVSYNSSGKIPCAYV
jgi:hypothetical protein